VGIFNLTPYDGCLEITGLTLKTRWEHGPTVKCLSLSDDSNVLNMSATTVGSYLMEAATRRKHVPPTPTCQHTPHHANTDNHATSCQTCATNTDMPTYATSVLHVQPNIMPNCSATNTDTNTCQHHESVRYYTQHQQQNIFALAQGWKNKQHILGNVAGYSPEMPEDQFPGEIKKPTLLICQLAEGASANLALVADVRKTWVNHAIHGPVWRERLIEFDKMVSFQQEAGPGDGSLADLPLHGAANAAALNWEQEPTSLDDFNRAYTIVHNLPARESFYTLHVVKAEGKNGFGGPVRDGQEFKLFLVATSDGEVDPQQFVIGHGPSNFLSPDKVVKLLDKGSVCCNCNTIFV
jgi:hypothetical protein